MGAKPQANRNLAEAPPAICILPTALDQPCWLDERDSGTIVATTNGLLDIERRRLYPHSEARPLDAEPCLGWP